MQLDIKTDTYVTAMAALRDCETSCQLLGTSPARYSAARLDLQSAMRREIERELDSVTMPAHMRPVVA